MDAILTILLFMAFLWFFTIFVLSRFFLPLLSFQPYPVPRKIPKEMRKAIDKIKKESKTKEEFLKKSYKLLTKKYHGGRLNTIFKPRYHFITGLDELWKMRGYIPCSNHNYLLRVFLEKSGLFSGNEIKIEYTFVNMNIHQYLKVNAGG
ncbi:hypothetical protein HY945_04380, partial [Candidatus Gottesmanbacteria bacterium]|nr:hypothetical protein [Candidatus Gottesmanbacteria bacterium]